MKISAVYFQNLTGWFRSWSDQTSLEEGSRGRIAVSTNCKASVVRG